MIHFAWPWMLLALPLPWLLNRWRKPAPARGEALFMPFAAQVGQGGARLMPKASKLRKALFMLVWLALIAAVVRPQWLGDPQAVATTGRRLLMAVDVSGSMATQDMAGDATRLQVVRAVGGAFIQRRHGDQVGLILFGSRPYLQAPLSADLHTVDQFLQESMVGVAGPQTAIGDAIGLAIKRLSANAPAARPGQGPAASKTVLILLTDGASNADAVPPLEAAKFAAAHGLRIYTIGVGALPQTGFFSMGSGGNNDLDETTLKEIAGITGGAYFRAADADTLQQVYASIDKLEPAAGKDQWVRPRTEWFAWPLALALLLSIPAVAWRRPA